MRGQCPRGKKCRFSHDLREIALATSRQNSEERTTASKERSAAQRERNRQSSRPSTDSNASSRSDHLNNENREQSQSHRPAKRIEPSSKSYVSFLVQNDIERTF